MMIQSNLFLNHQEIRWEQAGDGIQRQILGYDDKLMVVKVKFDQGSIGTVHNHPHSQATYVESGVFEMTIGGTTKIIKQGDSYYVPPYTDHGVLCIESGCLIDSFSPARWDFLQNNHHHYSL